LKWVEGKKEQLIGPAYPKERILLAAFVIIIGFLAAVEEWYTGGGASGGASGSVATAISGLIFLLSVLIARIILGLPLRPGGWI